MYVCTHEVRDTESIFDSENIKAVFDVGSCGQRKHTTENHLLPCVLFIDSW